MKKSILTLVLTVLCTAMSAQEADSFRSGRQRSGLAEVFIKADSLLYRYQHRATYDPEYMERNLHRWSFCTRSNLSNTALLTRGINDEQKFYTLMKADARYTQSFTVGYRSLYASIGISPGVFYGRDNNNIEFSLSSNGNMIGGEIIYHNAQEYKGKAQMGEEVFMIPASATTTKMIDGQAYFVLNHRKFSISAATNQGYVQKKSAGSLIVSAAIKGGSSHISGVKEVGNPDIDISYASIALGGGYGYNLVFKNMLMVHGSLRAALVLYNGGGVMNEGRITTIPMSFPDFVINGNFAVVYPFSKYFTGFGLTVRDDTYGNTGTMFIDNFRYKMNVFFGIRI